jgi:hypothetical protein
MDNPQPEPQKVFVTRYALTSGVYRTDSYSSNLNYVAFVKNPQGAIVTLKVGKSVFLTYKASKKILKNEKLLPGDTFVRLKTVNTSDDDNIFGIFVTSKTEIIFASITSVL